MFTKLVKSYKNKNLIIRIFIGLILGAILGVCAQNFDFEFIGSLVRLAEILGNLFIGGLKAIAPILVFMLIISSIITKNFSNAKGLKFVIILYLLGTFLASCVGVGFSFLFPVELTINTAQSALTQTPSTIGEVLKGVLFKIADNPLNAISSGNFIAILAWSIALGIALRHSNQSTKNLFSDVAKAFTKVVEFIIEFAPFGIFGIVAQSVAGVGLGALGSYAKIVVLLVGAMLFVALVINPLIVWFCLKKNPFPLIFVCLKNSGLTAFFTRSSAANIPVNMSLCQKLKLDEELYPISIPIGANINMAGAAVVIAVLALSTAFTLGIRPDFGSALLLCLISAIGACGASGVTGGSLMLIPLACSLFNISSDTAMEVIAIGFVIGVIQDSLETAINSSTDVVFTAVACYKTDPNSLYDEEIFKSI